MQPPCLWWHTLLVVDILDLVIPVRAPQLTLYHSIRASKQLYGFYPTNHQLQVSPQMRIPLFSTSTTSRLGQCQVQIIIKA